MQAKSSLILSNNQSANTYCWAVHNRLLHSLPTANSERCRCDPHTKNILPAYVHNLRPIIPVWSIQITCKISTSQPAHHPFLCIGNSVSLPIWSLWFSPNSINFNTPELSNDLTDWRRKELFVFLFATVSHNWCFSPESNQMHSAMMRCKFCLNTGQLGSNILSETLCTVRRLCILCKPCAEFI